MESSRTTKRKLIGRDEIGQNRIDGKRDETELNGTVGDGTGRNKIGCAGLGQGEKRRYRMGPNGIERNWMGEDGMGQNATREGWRMVPPIFPN